VLMLALFEINIAIPNFCWLILADIFLSIPITCL
jgi:hypothetical protein